MPHEPVRPQHQDPADTLRNLSAVEETERRAYDRGRETERVEQRIGGLEREHRHMRHMLDSLTASVGEIKATLSSQATEQATTARVMREATERLTVKHRVWGTLAGLGIALLGALLGTHVHVHV